MCILYDISISIVGFGDWACACRLDTPTSHQKQICYPSTWLFDGLSDNNASDNQLFLTVRLL